MLYSEFVASRDRDSKRLMVMLHGLGDSIEGFRWFPEAMGLPWLNYLLVNAPDDYYGGFSWFDLENIPPGVRRSRQSLFDLLDDLRAKNYPPELITLGGFSQGCLMSVEVALSYPQVLAGVVGISGWVSGPETLIREMPPAAKRQRILMTHGTNDPIVPLPAVEPQVPLLRAAGIDVTFKVFPKAHTIAGEAEMSVIRDFVKAGYPA